MLRLYSFRRSPNPLKVRFALAELDLEYQTVEISLFEGAQRKPEFREVSSRGQVPVLQDGDLTLCESGAILVHLATRYDAGPTTLWPRDVRHTSLAMQWLFFEAAHLQGPCGTLWWNDIMVPFLGGRGASADVIASDSSSLERSLGLLEDHLQSREWMVGDQLTVVDCSIGVALAMLRGTRLDDAKRWPLVTAYRERIRHRPAWTVAQGDAIHPG